MDALKLTIRLKNKYAPLWLVHAIRPVRDRLLRSLYGSNGIPWSVNGLRIQISPELRDRFPPDHDEGVFDYLAKHVKPGQTCFNIGANVGIYVLKFAKLSGPNGSIVAVEPNSLAREWLDRHIRMNALADRVTLVNVAVGETPRDVEFFRSGSDGMSRPTVPHASLDNGVERVFVEMRTLDQLQETAGYSPDWMIMDIEGFELPALKGGRSLLKAGTRFVVEMHPTQWSGLGYSRIDVERFLSTNALRAVPLQGQNDPLEQQGMVLLDRLI